ncbi:MAG: isoprenylcysteine carboxylmethyltransferase family protein [Candidatus Saganbacteria bacterium]|nr:isoprenylcysteine carboxylmethyltransferase family protein [Candidatus Saganbacteria bacterium]
MAIQLLLVLLFVLNDLLIWIGVFYNKFRWYRFPAPVIFLIILFLMVYVNQPRFEMDFFWWRVVGMAAIVIGVGVMIWARWAFKKAGVESIGLPQTLVTYGPYQYVRHPQYLGFIFLSVGWFWVWSAVYAFYFGLIIVFLIWLSAYLEEKLILEKKFGKQYLEYRQQTGMFWLK